MTEITEKTFYKYPSIEQFRTILKNLKTNIYFDGMANDEPVYDYSRTLPSVRIFATEKIHGTNGAVIYSNGEIYAQSRNNIITPLKDNQGFAGFVETNKEDFMWIFEELKAYYNLEDDIVLFGEFAGGNIQKNSACTGLDKKFYIFNKFKSGSNWYKSDASDFRTDAIKNITDFKTWNFEVDFNSDIEISKFLENVQNVISEIEEESPLGKALGKETNIGEGIVCEFSYNNVNYIFKCKGEKHSTSKVTKSQTPADREKLSAAEKCAEEICHTWRFEQGIVETCGSIDKVDIKQIGEYLKWVSQDTLKEESDIITSYTRELGIEFKEVIQRVQKRAKQYFLEIYNSSI